VRSLLASMERLRCFFMKSGLLIMAYHNFETHRKRTRLLTGNSVSISAMNSGGRVDIDGGGIRYSDVKDEEDESVKSLDGKKTERPISK
jgi:hypothetical protein